MDVKPWKNPSEMFEPHRALPGSRCDPPWRIFERQAVSAALGRAARSAPSKRTAILESDREAGTGAAGKLKLWTRRNTAVGKLVHPTTNSLFSVNKIAALAHDARVPKSIRTKERRGKSHGQISRESKERSEEEGADEEAGRQEAYREELKSGAAHAICSSPGRAPGKQRTRSATA